MITHGNEIEIFSGNSNKALAEAIARNLKMQSSKIEVSTFSDGEISVSVFDTVRGKDVYLIQSTSSPVNDNLMELLIMIDAVKRASAGRITAVIPYFGYARQDRKARSRDPITAKLVANLLVSAGADRILTMDLHAAQIQGFFDIPVDHLLGGNLLAHHYKKIVNGDDYVVVSPDVGSVARSRNFASKLNIPLAVVDKRRPKANAIEVMNVIGDVKGKKCIMVDDMADTAGTLCQGAVALMNFGAKSVEACCTHGVLSGPAIERINASPIQKLVLTDTIDQTEKLKLCNKLEVISVAPLFAKAITKIYSDTSISEIYGD